MQQVGEVLTHFTHYLNMNPVTIKFMFHKHGHNEHSWHLVWLVCTYLYFIGYSVKNIWGCILFQFLTIMK